MQAYVTSIFGSDINTDDIIRADVLQEEWDKENFAIYAFDKFDPSFRERCKTKSANVIIADSNFGSGSSREQAVYAIKYNNVSFVIAKKDSKTGVAFPDIFYRNAINNDLPLITVDTISGISMGDNLVLDLEQKVVKNVSTGDVLSFEMSDEDISILRDGGLIGLAKQDIRARLTKIKEVCNVRK